MAPTHECPCGCGSPVPQHRLACKPGWFRLPFELRSDVNAAYRKRNREPRAHLLAVRRALAWYRDNPMPS